MVERFEIGRGLDLPLAGEPSSEVDAKETSQVAIVADDYIGMRPTLIVAEGDRVELGQPVFHDKKTEGVTYTAPASGKVLSINRGEKRRFLSLIIERDGDQDGKQFKTFDAGEISSLTREQVVEQLLDSGLWTCLRNRPFSRVPSPKVTPQAVFINAMDSNPHAVDPSKVIADASEAFLAGVEIVSKLTEGPTYLSRRPNSGIPGDTIRGIQIAEFDGPHPAGLVGTHMHFLKPASLDRVNWHVNYQDAIAIGQLFLNGRLDVSRTVSLAGPSVKNPRLIKTQIGASLDQIIDGELSGDNNRIVSGSVLCGRTSVTPTNFLGRFHLQVSCLEEGNKREFLGWQMPGFDKFSVTRAFASAWGGSSKFSLSTSTGGSERAMVPIGSYEKVMPLDMLPTPLLRSLISRDTISAQELGCLELDEEDLGLCTFVCPGKYEYGQILRDNLLTIEKEG